ncbi:hypothetical protein [Naasia sp. SYSU D00948]|uniref:hypothetical protein n=1 Tax=Naasia sp. SYSU D00948 TaxID=2817379 RepID=UPI001B30FF35|nr:hypothetical protein [Naasia sp. SYSU D00948]
MASAPAPRARSSRAERTLGGMAAAVIGLSVLAILAVLIAGALGVSTGSGIWVTIALLPLIGLPIGLMLIIAFIVVSAVNRSRQARSSR